MNAFILAAAMFFTNAAIYSEEHFGANGFYVRLINNTSVASTCHIADEYGSYYEFRLYPSTTGRWYRIYGTYKWQCY